MDPVGLSGLSVGVVALYSACRDCYIYFTTVKLAEKDSLIHLRELDIQHSILKAWGFYWKIQRHDTIIGVKPTELGKENEKLRGFLERNLYKADDVLGALCAISDTLSSGDKLVKKYGLKLKPVKGYDIEELGNDVANLEVNGNAPNTIQDAAAKVRKRLSFITRCRWAINDRDQFKILITDLKAYNDALYRLCPEGAFEPMNIHLTLECLHQKDSYMGLRRTAKLASQLAENSISPSQGALQLLTLAAQFKAQVVKIQTARPLPEAEMMADMIDPEHLKDLGQSLALFNGKVVYVERKSYAATREEQEQFHAPRRRSISHWSVRNVPIRDDWDIEDSRVVEPNTEYAGADLEMRENILKLYNTLRKVQSREHFLSLKPIAVVNYVQGQIKNYIGIIYELPGALGTVSRAAPAEDTMLRGPESLRSLHYHNKRNGRSHALGARLQLAKKIVAAVAFLHASGWVHKNIRTSSILFFPKSSTDIDVQPIKLDEPYLAGYDFSRPDDMREDYAVARNFHEENMLNRIERSPRTGEITLDYYHHPDKRASPKRLYQHAFDVYSLGIVLLEIGLWRNIQDDSRAHEDTEWGRDVRRRWIPQDPYEFRRFVLATYLSDLRFYCGDVYAKVVFKCLMVDASDDYIGRESQRELCARITADLSECSA